MSVSKLYRTDPNVLCIFAPSLSSIDTYAGVSDIAVICREDSSVQRIGRIFVD